MLIWGLEKPSKNIFCLVSARTFAYSAIQFTMYDEDLLDNGSEAIFFWTCAI